MRVVVNLLFSYELILKELVIIVIYLNKRNSKILRLSYTLKIIMDYCNLTHCGR